MGLAEVKIKNKQQWALNPNPGGRSWVNDKDKFGLKLMEKMGYEKGKGLGAKESGDLLPVAVKPKNNSSGIGFDIHGHDDTWLAHQDDFSAVLASLNVEHGTTEEIKEEGKKSLERLSKKSRRRVHYQKFTRGKDLANYSKDDLGSILGTKSEKFKEKQKERLKEDEKSSEEEEIGAEEKSNGLVTIKGGNYQDYFEKKMAALKAKGLYKYTGDMDLAGDNGGYDPLKLFKSSVNEDKQEITDKENSEGEGEKRKKKKCKKDKDNSEEVATIEETTEEVPKKKSKKSKHKEEIVQQEEEKDQDSQKVEKKKKKKKDKKEKQEIEDSTVVQSEQVEQVNTDKSKKKKKKRKQLEEVSETLEEEPSKKRKKDKSV